MLIIPDPTCGYHLPSRGERFGSLDVDDNALFDDPGEACVWTIMLSDAETSYFTRLKILEMNVMCNENNLQVSVSVLYLYI